jgi:iron complex transport system substrate-binding protein
MHLFKLIASYLVLYLFGAIALATENSPKVVSLNVCTDQFVMLIADDSQIISLSEISTDTLSSAMAEEASKYHQNNSGAEEVYLLQPDIVFAGIYTAKATVNMLESLGLRVEKFEPASTVEQIILNIQRTGELLGHTDRANTLVANFESRLTDLTTGINTRPRAALYYANGYTTGENTLAGQILDLAGFSNIASEVGILWGGTLPLELLIMSKPDVIITGTTYPGSSRSEEILKHPALKPLRHVSSTDANWVCGTPHIVKAIMDLQTIHPDKMSTK